MYLINGEIWFLPAGTLTGELARRLLPEHLPKLKNIVLAISRRECDLQNNILEEIYVETG
jgi:hypothetical protein